MDKIKTLFLAECEDYIDPTPFGLYSYDTSFKPKPMSALYCMVREIDPKKLGTDHEIIFLGSADDLKYALEHHTKTECFKSKGVKYIGVRYTDDSYELSSSFYDTLYKRYEPDCNL